MVKLQSGNCYVKKSKKTGENQNVISENPQEVSEVELLPMLNEGSGENQNSDDPRSNSPTDSVESTYYSCPESAEEDDANRGNRSEENSQEVSEVELWLMRNESKAEEETNSDPRSYSPPTSEESSYISCPEENVPRAEPPSASDQYCYHLPTKQQKQIFFETLKGLLENPLEYGQKGVHQWGGHILELIYMEEKCELVILNSDGVRQWRCVMETKDIYLEWRGDHVESLSLAHIENVCQKLKILGIQNDRLWRCFSLAKNEFMGEPSCVQKNMELKIICEGINIVFGKGENLATVFHDDNLRRPAYDMKVKDWWVLVIVDGQLNKDWCCFPEVESWQLDFFTKLLG